MAKCIVTGGNGFIGRHVVRALREAGNEVSVIDLEGEGEQVNICDTEALTRAFKELKPQFVFHLAAVADAREALENPVKAVQVNVGGTASVLKAAHQSDIGRVVLASTCWVGNAMGAGILDESQPFLPTGGGHTYTTTKIAVELLAHDFHTYMACPSPSCVTVYPMALACGLV